MASNPVVQPRKQEVIYRWWAIFATGILVLLIIVKYLNPNAWVLTLSVVGLLLIVFRLTKAIQPWDYGSAINACRQREIALTGLRIDDMPSNCEVVPHGPYWHVHFISPGVTYTIYPEQQRIIGRRIRRPDDIIAQTDRSDISRTFAKDRAVDRLQRQELDRAGYDVEEEHEEDTTTN